MNASQVNAEMLKALKQFVEQATKLSGFPHLYQPYVAAVINAKTAIAHAETDDELRARSGTRCSH